jgi:hypothetical protein
MNPRVDAMLKISIVMLTTAAFAGLLIAAPNGPASTKSAPPLVLAANDQDSASDRTAEEPRQTATRPYLQRARIANLATDAPVPASTKPNLATDAAVPASTKPNLATDAAVPASTKPNLATDAPVPASTKSHVVDWNAVPLPHNDKSRATDWAGVTTPRRVAATTMHGSDDPNFKRISLHGHPVRPLHYPRRSA